MVTLTGYRRALPSGLSFENRSVAGFCPAPDNPPPSSRITVRDYPGLAFGITLDAHFAVAWRAGKRLVNLCVRPRGGTRSWDQDGREAPRATTRTVRIVGRPPSKKPKSINALKCANNWHFDQRASPFQKHHVLETWSGIARTWPTCEYRTIASCQRSVDFNESDSAVMPYRPPRDSEKADGKRISHQRGRSARRRCSSPTFRAIRA